MSIYLYKMELEMLKDKKKLITRAASIATKQPRIEFSRFGDLGTAEGKCIPTPKDN